MRTFADFCCGLLQFQVLRIDEVLFGASSGMQWVRFYFFNWKIGKLKLSQKQRCGTNREAICWEPHHCHCPMWVWQQVSQEQEKHFLTNMQRVGWLSKVSRGTAFAYEWSCFVSGAPSGVALLSKGRNPLCCGVGSALCGTVTVTGTLAQFLNRKAMSEWRIHGLLIGLNWPLPTQLMSWRA